MMTRSGHLSDGAPNGSSRPKPARGRPGTIPTSPTGASIAPLG